MKPTDLNHFSLRGIFIPMNVEVLKIEFFEAKDQSSFKCYTVYVTCKNKNNVFSIFTVFSDKDELKEIHDKLIRKVEEKIIIRQESTVSICNCYTQKLSFGIFKPLLFCIPSPLAT